LIRAAVFGYLPSLTNPRIYVDNVDLVSAFKNVFQYTLFAETKLI